MKGREFLSSFKRLCLPHPTPTHKQTKKKEKEKEKEIGRRGRRRRSFVSQVSNFQKMRNIFTKEEGCVGCKQSFPRM